MFLINIFFNYIIPAEEFGIAAIEIESEKHNIANHVCYYYFYLFFPKLVERTLN